MSVNYVQDGDIINYVNGTGAAIASGSVVVVGNLLGVALADIAIGGAGSLAVEGVFNLPKVAGAVIAQGETVNWNTTSKKIDDNLAVPAAGHLTGGCVAFESAGAGVPFIAVSLNVGANTVA